MPEHVLLAHLAAMLAPVAGTLAVVYALAPSTRAVLRWPLVGLAVAAAVVLVMADGPGHVLLDRLHASGQVAEYEAAFRHAKSSDVATTSAVVLAVVGPLAAWRLGPERPRGRFAAVILALLVLSGLALIAGTVYTVVLGLAAVWSVA